MEQNREEVKGLESKLSPAFVDTTIKEESSLSIEREEIEHTPFLLVGIPEEKFLALGNYRLTPGIKADEVGTIHEKVEKMLGGIDWNLLVCVISSILDADTKAKKIEAAEIYKSHH